MSRLFELRVTKGILIKSVNTVGNNSIILLKIKLNFRNLVRIIEINDKL